MSWLFSQALVAAYSADCLPDGTPFAQLNVMPTPHPFLRNGKTTPFSRPSPFGLTLEVLTAQRGEALLTWFRGDFLAKTYPLPEKVRGLTARDLDCGANFSGSFARFDRASHTLKTAQLSLGEDFTESSVILPRSGEMRSGVVRARAIKVPGTNATGCGLLPTLTVCGNNNQKGLSEKSGDGLATALRRMLPTITVQDSKNNGNRSSMGRNTKPLSAEIGGPLNPEWCEWFMGWPIGWTELGTLGTDKFQSWLRAHGKG